MSTSYDVHNTGKMFKLEPIPGYFCSTGIRVYLYLGSIGPTYLSYPKIR